MTLVHYKAYSGQPFWHFFRDKGAANGFATRKIEKGINVAIRPFDDKADAAIIKRAGKPKVNVFLK